MFSEIKIAIKCNTKIKYSVWWCDAMTKDIRRKEMNNNNNNNNDNTNNVDLVTDFY